MKENRYDDQEFFEKYSHMSRSEKGLAGAGEWPVDVYKRQHSHSGRCFCQYDFCISAHLVLFYSFLSMDRRTELQTKNRFFSEHGFQESFDDVGAADEGAQRAEDVGENDDQQDPGHAVFPHALSLIHILCRIGINDFNWSVVQQDLR